MRYAECHSGRLCFLWRLQLRERRGSGNVETIVGYRHYKYRAEAMQVVWNCSFHYINYDWSRAVAWPLGHAPLRPRPLLRPLPSHESSVSAKLWWVSIKSADLAKVRDTLGPDADRMWTLISIWFLWHGSGRHALPSLCLHHRFYAMLIFWVHSYWVGITHMTVYCAWTSTETSFADTAMTHRWVWPEQWAWPKWGVA